MKTATIKIIAKGKYNLVFNAYEVKSNSGYGNEEITQTENGINVY